MGTPGDRSGDGNATT